MVRGLQTKFDLDLHSGFRETWVYGREDGHDGRLRHDSSSADSQAELKNGLEIWGKLRYPSTEFGINLLDGFWENGFYRRRTDDGSPRDDSSSAVQ